MSVATSTSFRDWMRRLNEPRGAEPEWPLLLREMLAAEYCRQQNLGVCYASEVFIDRDGDYPQDAIKAEPKAVKVAEGFQRWVSKPGFVRPDAFGSITPSRDSLHEVIVLASAEY